MGRGGGNTTSRGSTRIYLAVCIPRGPRPGLPKIKVQVMTRRRSIWCLRRRVVFGMRREMTKPQKLRARLRASPDGTIEIRRRIAECRGAPGSIRGNREPPRWSDSACSDFAIHRGQLMFLVLKECKVHSINMT